VISKKIGLSCCKCSAAKINLPILQIDKRPIVPYIMYGERRTAADKIANYLFIAAEITEYMFFA